MRRYNYQAFEQICAAAFPMSHLVDDKRVVEGKPSRDYKGLADAESTGANDNEFAMVEVRRCLR